jgi:transmembrane sensor
MESRESKLIALGAKVRDALDAEGGASEAIRDARASLLARVANGEVQHRPAAPRRLLYAGAATAALALAFFIWIRLPVTFRVGPAGAPGHLGDLLEAPGAEPLALQFSEGSSIVVAAHGRVRVLAAEASGARVLVESGAADIAIRHRQRRATRWGFEVGPFHVLVTGTKFRVDWSPERQTLDLDQREGSVVISGACLSEPRPVATGESVSLSCAPGPARAAAPSANTGVRTPRAASAAPLEAPAPAPLATPRLSAPAPARPDWRQLIASGQYRDGLRAVERVGFDRACRTATDAELLALADAARLSDRPGRAAATLEILRRRFPGSDAAATAAFALGRVAFEQGGAYGTAARWFAVYASERPGGPLIGDAVGRLMEARQRAGDRAGARADAERYLSRFPEGPYAAIARAILAR